MTEAASGVLLTTVLFIMGISLVLMVIIPVLPGQFIIWLAALVYGLLAGWENLGWPAFVMLTVAMLIAAGVDLAAGWWGAKRGGAGNNALWWGVGLGLIGLVVFNAVGAMVGALLGIAGYEYRQDHDFKRAMKAVGGYLLGLLVSLVARFFIALGMIGIFMGKVL